MSQAGALNSSGGSGGTADIQKINVQTGTSPVVTSNNTITFNGAVVAAGTNPVRTDGTAPATMALEVQTSQAIASTDATKIGLAAFNSSDFSVDANGFVSFTGGGSSITIAGDSGSDTGSSFTISGGSTGLTTSMTGSTLDLTGTLDLANGGTNASLTASNGGIFYSTASAGAILSGTATAHQMLQSGSSTTPAWSTSTWPATTTVNQILYSSSANTVAGLATGNNGVLITSAAGVPSILADGTTGQILTATTGAPPSWENPAASSISITGNTGGALTGNAFTFTGGTTGLVFGGAGSTETLSGTLDVANGGTGDTSFTAYSVLCGGTTSTGVLQNVSGVGTSGQVLTSNGAAALPTWQAAGGGGITTIDGDTGSATGSTVTFTANPSAGASVNFSATGSTATLNVTDSNFNTLIGDSSGNGSLTSNTCTGVGKLTLNALTSGTGNTAVGSSCGSHLTSGSNSSFFGTQCGAFISTGTDNTAVGLQALANNGGTFNGSYNLALGENAGFSYTGTESSNLLVGNFGTVGDNHIIRIGRQGSGALQQNACFIAGIDGVSITGSTVLCSSTGQLGDVVSSQRFKEDIKDIDNTDALLTLNPVSFKYKSETEKYEHYGLIAEDVHLKMPSLVIYDNEKKPYSIKYHEMPALLLAEIKKLRSEINELKGRFHA